MKPASSRSGVLAWVLGVLLAFSVVSHYVTGSKFEAACVRAESVLQRLGPAAASDQDAVALANACSERLSLPEGD